MRKTGFKKYESNTETEREVQLEGAKLGSGWNTAQMALGG
jgi:hypothetical protein